MKEVEKNTMSCPNFQTFRESVRDRGWTELKRPPSYHLDDSNKNNNKGEFLVLAPMMDGDNGLYRHIMRVSN